MRKKKPDRAGRKAGLPARQTAEKPEQNYIFRLKIYILRLETEHDDGIRKLVSPKNNSYLPPPFFFPV